jgi:hypothetical protein
VWTVYDYGGDVAPPVFEFVQDEDLQKERAERDVKLYALGWRPGKAYIEREYEIPAEDFELEGSGRQEMRNGIGERRFASCLCGYGGDIAKHDFFQDYKPSLFASKEEKRKAKDYRLMNEFAAKDYRLMNEFARRMLEAGQEEIDKAVEAYADALGMITDYTGASEALLSTFKRRSLDDFTHIIDEARFATQGIGGNNA